MIIDVPKEIRKEISSRQFHFLLSPGSCVCFFDAENSVFLCRGVLIVLTLEGNDIIVLYDVVDALARLGAQNLVLHDLGILSFHVCEVSNSNNTIMCNIGQKLRFKYGSECEFKSTNKI